MSRLTPSPPPPQLRLLLYPFNTRQRGPWGRSAPEPGPGTGPGQHKPPSSDPYAPDLYLPTLSFCSYCLLCCVADALSSPSRFKPERLARFGWWASVAWLAQAAVLWAGLGSLAGGSPAVPLLDLAAYSGYSFVRGTLRGEQ